MKLKLNIAKKIHLWIGLISGLIASLSGLSGALYVWQPELSRALNPEILSVRGAETLKEETIHKTAYELYRNFGDNLLAIHLPNREQQSIQLVLENGESRFFHPQTGNMLGEKTSSIRFFEGLLSFHRTLLIPKYGKYLVGGSAVLFFSLLLTSGSFFTFMPTYKRALRILDEPVKTAEATTKNEPLTHVYPEQVLSLPPQDGYKLRAVYFPTEASGHYRFRYIKDRVITAGLRKTKQVQINQNYEVIMSTDFRQSQLSEKIVAQVYPIHIGETLGLFGWMLVFITGFIPTILSTTGYRFYLHYRHRLSARTDGR